MSFFGKEYKLERQENFDGFLNSLGPDVTPDLKQKLLAAKPSIKLDKNGDSYKLLTLKGDGSNSEVTFKSGQEVDEKVGDRVAKSTYTIDGNTVTQIQKFDNGVILTVKREFSDKDIVATISSSVWDGVARRYYKA